MVAVMHCPSTHLPPSGVDCFGSGEAVASSFSSSSSPQMELLSPQVATTSALSLKALLAGHVGDRVYELLTAIVHAHTEGQERINRIEAGMQDCGTRLRCLEERIGSTATASCSQPAATAEPIPGVEPTVANAGLAAAKEISTISVKRCVEICNEIAEKNKDNKRLHEQICEEQSQDTGFEIKPNVHELLDVKEQSFKIDMQNNSTSLREVTENEIISDSVDEFPAMQPPMMVDSSTKSEPQEVNDLYREITTTCQPTASSLDGDQVQNFFEESGNAQNVIFQNAQIHESRISTLVASCTEESMEACAQIKNVNGAFEQFASKDSASHDRAIECCSDVAREEQSNNSETKQSTGEDGCRIECSIQASNHSSPPAGPIVDSANSSSETAHQEECAEIVISQPLGNHYYDSGDDYVIEQVNLGEAVVFRKESQSKGEVPDGIRIVIRELPMADGVHASTGCQLWPSSIVLAQELLRNPHLIAGKQVIEVGAGCGLLGIVAARLARRILLTDHDEEVLTNLTHNLKTNKALFDADPDKTPCQIETRRLDWFEVPKVGWPRGDRADVIVASDIMYGNWGDSVAQAMARMLAPGGRILLAASEDRMTSMQHFKDEIIELGYKVLETKWKRSDGKFRLYECCRRTPREDKYTIVERRLQRRPAPVEPTQTNGAGATGKRSKNGKARSPSPPMASLPSATAAASSQSKINTSMSTLAVASSPAASLALATAAVISQSEITASISKVKVTSSLVASLPSATAAASSQSATATASSHSKVNPSNLTFKSPTMASLPLATAPNSTQLKQRWRVVGGLLHGGIIVRDGCDGPRSSYLGRLEHGSLVEETTRTEERIAFTLICGTGPRKGWVSLSSAAGTPLLIENEQSV